MTAGGALEDAVLGLVEADTASIGRGDFTWTAFEVPLADLAAIVGLDADGARAFLEDEIAEAGGMAGHWEGMLEGEFPDSDLPPVLFVEDGSASILDGVHRTAALVACGVDPVLLIVGFAPGAEPADALPAAAGWTPTPDWSMVAPGGDGPRP